jgi:anti-sigma-K factor RskA
MNTRPTSLPQDLAADYVLNQLSDAEMAEVEQRIASEATMRQEVRGLSDAAAAIVFTTRQVTAPALAKP